MIKKFASDTVDGHQKIKSHLGIRGIAASMVVFYHLGFGIGFRFWIEKKDFIFGRSYLCVDLFFILSGFIISYANKADRDEAITWIEAKKFFKNRFARIYPLHLVCLLTLVLYTILLSFVYDARGINLEDVLWSPDKIIALFLQTLLLQSFGPAKWILWNIPSWSISAEMFAYVAFVAFIYIRKRNKFLQMMLLYLSSSLFYGYILLNGRNLDIVAGLAPLRCLAGFCLGMLVFYCRRSVERIPVAMLNFFQVTGLILATCDLSLGWNDLVAIPAFFLIVYTTCYDKGILSTILSAPPIQFLGKISYSIYLTHVPLIAILNTICLIVERRIPKFSEELSRSIYIIFIFSSVCLVSNLTYLYVEGPGRAWILKQFSSARRTAAPG